MNKSTNVFSNIESFTKKFPNTPKEGNRKKALEVYFASKGVVRAYPSEKEWPKLTYPDCFILDQKVKEIREKKELIEKNLVMWKKKYSQAKNYHKNNQLKKLKEPLYWKHKTKSIVDPSYRKDFEQVSLPVHLVGDSKWKPMVKMFINDLEYRKQLVETVRESIVYKKNKKVAKYADDLKDFRMETSNKQITELEKKLEKVKKLEESLKEIQKWSKE